MLKHLSILIIISTVFLSGCVDLTDSDNDSENEFIGDWKHECDNGKLTVSTFSKEQLTTTYYTFENLDCTGTSEGYIASIVDISYGDKVIVNSGVEATQVLITIAGVNDDITIYELMYRDGNNLYSGDGSGTADTWPTDLNYDGVFTLQ